MSEPLVYLNDRFLLASQAKLNIYDLGKQPTASRVRGSKDEFSQRLFFR